MAQARRPAGVARPDGRLTKRFGLLAGAIIAVFAYAVSGYMLLGFGFVDALYMSALALTTAGFNPVGDLDTGAKLFTVSVALFGVSIFLAILTTLGRAIAEGRLFNRRRRMERRIAGLKDHLVVCAYGRVGRTVAREFEAERVDYVVIDKDPGLEPMLIRDGVAYLIADPTQEPVLQSAGIERARGLVCAMDSDSENVYITIAARALNPDLFIVARAAEEISAERLYQAGADRVVSPYVTSGREMALKAIRPRVIDYFELGHREVSDLRLEELQIEPGSELIGRKLGEAVGSTMALAVRRVGGQLVPNPPPDLRLSEGDLLVLMGPREALRPVEE